MNHFFIEYRDPLFGLLVLFFIIFIISFISYFWGMFKSKDQQKNIEEFIKRFEFKKDEEGFNELLKSFNLSLSSLELLANFYTKSGEFETAIELYLLILNQNKNIFEKKHILNELGKTYFKAGFLIKSSDVFLQSLKLAPRDKTALRYLVVCYEKLKSYTLSLQALESLEELGCDTANQKAYLQALCILDDIALEKDQKLAHLEKLSLHYPQIQRMLIEFKQNDIKKSDFTDDKSEFLLDLAWSIDVDFSKQNGIYEDIFNIKNNIDKNLKSDVFELEVLHNLNKQNYEKATINFAYTCKDCKHNYPIFFYRCPNCFEIFSAKIDPILVKKSDEANLSFQ